MAKLFIQEETLNAIGDAIRSKNGENTLYSPGAMPDAIRAIETGSDVSSLKAEFSGNLNYLFMGGNWDWYVDFIYNELGKEIITNNVSSGLQMFGNSKLKTIPFNINCSNDHGQFNYMFYNSNIETAPNIYNLHAFTVSNMFEGCKRLRSIPEGYHSTWDVNGNVMNTYPLVGVFKDCYSLRTVPASFVKNFCVPYGYSMGLYRECFWNCYSLDEIREMGIVSAASGFSSMFDNAHRLSAFTFEKNEDGTSKTAEWNGKTIDLSNHVGYAVSVSNITDYNSGITADKQVNNSATYEALKEDPDWFTLSASYSRYNLNSALETIDSLPDCSAVGGINTIKFKEAAGQNIGLKIGDMTEEQIAAAAAKGWTVSFV